MKQEDKLKPCPFCGGQATFVGDFDDVWVKCENCGVTTDFFLREKQAVVAWNNRPIERKLLNRISSLELDLAHFPEDFYRRTTEQLQKENKRYFDAFVKVKEFLEESRLWDYPWFYNVDNKDIQYVFDIVDKTLRGENVKKM